ncbi:MAG TPA: hypothetical protein VFO00_14195, partial [Vitreimonas sp.]|nr:hypothetical protein [Vitreimonas sp.]
MKRALALAVALAACAPAPTMTVDEARAVIDAVGRGDSPVDICTSDGRNRFRAAVRTYAHAQDEAGVIWPRLFGGPEAMNVMPDAGELAVTGGLLVGYVEPSDLRGDARRWASMLDMGMQLNADGRTFLRGMEGACAEVVELQQIMAREQVEAFRLQRSIERATERGDHERASELSERYARRAASVQRRAARLIEQIQQKVGP